jgi:Zn-dependent protease with chaperone function
MNLPRKHLIRDALALSVILFLFQSIFILLEKRSLFLVFIMVAVLSLYPVLIRPYRLIKQGTYRNSGLEKWLYEQTQMKAVILVSPKKFGNALAYGILPVSRVIIISKDLYDGFTPDQIHGIVLHEAGHLKYRHTLVLTVYNSIAAFLQSLLLMFLLRNNVMNESPLVYFSLIGAFALLQYFLPAPVYRLMELKADSYAARYLGGLSYAETLRRLDELTDSGVSKNDFYHPPLSKRIKNVEK